MAEVHHTLKDRTVVTETGCIEWTGCRTDRGYGRITIGYKTYRVHRVSYQLSVGEIPEGQCVLHECDNPPCLNPDHLFLGSNKDNTQDMLRKGRGNRAAGASHWNAKLTPEQVLKIREDKRTLDVISAEYGINRSTISLIRRGEIWKSLTE